MTTLKEKQKLAGIQSARLMKERKQNAIEEYNKSPKLCVECNSPIDYSKRRNKLCSQTCSASFSNKKRKEAGWRLSTDSLERLKVSGKKYGHLARPKAVRHTVTCKICEKLFTVLPSSANRKYCSRSCRTSDSGLYKKCGGYRQGSGYSKSGYYKGIYCQSTYELCWVIWALDNRIKFSRFKGILEGNGLKYVPDFLLEDGITIIEIKGYERTDSVEKKTKLAESLGYKVNVLRKQDLNYIFEYVKQNYKTNKFETLYGPFDNAS